MCLVLRSIFDEGRVVHGQPMDGCGTVKNIPNVCWTENFHVNWLELDGMDCVENDTLMHVN